MPARLALPALTALLALLPAVLGGCAGGSAPTRFFVLTAAGAPAPGASAAPGLPVGVGPVTLPGYLDRVQIVTRSGPDALDLAEFDRWAEPLRENIGAVLAEDLAGRLPSQRVAVFPWRQTREIAYQVPVQVMRFERQPGGEVLLAARWRILSADGAERAVRTSSLTEPGGRGGYADLVSAMSRLLARLAEEIAAEINRLAR